MENDGGTNTQVAKVVRLGRSRYGVLEPQVDVTVPKGTHFRTLNATLLRLAAELELATPAREGGIVGFEARSDTHGRVHLELVHGTREEADRGIALLKRLAG